MSEHGSSDCDRRNLTAFEPGRRLAMEIARSDFHHDARMATAGSVAPKCVYSYNDAEKG